MNHAGLAVLLTVLLNFGAALAQDRANPAAQQSSPWAAGLDAYEVLLTDAVKMTHNGSRSEVDYGLLKQRRAELTQVLTAFSAISRRQFDAWPDHAQLAFLINAYNAFTLELILTEYPDLESIKDLGSLFRSPWKKAFFSLLGERRSLDELEHTMIRGNFREPRIHVAVNCASCGCPALLNQPFRAENLDAQLEQAMAAFLADTTRNGYDSASQTLRLSPIFNWYDEDFIQSAGSVQAYVKPWADQLGLPATESDAPASLRLKFTDYDWQLNDLGRCAGP